MSTDTTPYVARPAERFLNSFRVACATYAITLQATLEGYIRVHVATLPEPGRDYEGALTSETPTEFAADEITVSDTRLECLAASRWSTTTFFRAGFAVALEPGMSDATHAVLVQLLPLAKASRQVSERVDALLAREEGLHEHQRGVDGFNYMHGAAEETIAAVWLDGDGAAEAANRAFARYERGGSWDNAGCVFKACIVRAIEEKTA